MIRVIFVAALCFTGAFSRAEETGESKALYTNVYTVHPSFLHTSNKAEDNQPHDPFAEKTAERPQTAKRFFERRGVKFGLGAFVTSSGSTSGITLRNTLAEIAKVEAILKAEMQSLVPKGLGIAVEYIEVDEAVYHEWMFENRLNTPGGVFRRQVQEWVRSGDARIAETMCVMARSGQRAKTQSVSELIYPTEPGVPGISNVVTLEGRKSEAPVRAAVPSAMETRYLGATMEVDPIIGSDSITVDLSLSPEVVQSIGLIDWPPASKDGFFTISLPRIYVVKVATQVTLLSKGYALLGVGRAHQSEDRKKKRPMVLMFARADVSRLGGFKKISSTAHQK